MALKNVLQYIIVDKYVEYWCVVWLMKETIHAFRTHEDVLYFIVTSNICKDVEQSIA